MGRIRDRKLHILPHDLNLGSLENLVDELIKDAPNEEKVRAGMEAVGLSYTQDPIVRMTKVLNALDKMRARKRAPETEI